jgi:plastocyanin
MQADPVCASKHTEKVLSEAVLVNENNTLANVFVYVSKGLEGKTFDIPAEPVVLDQKGCLYSPRVLGVMAGQKIKILNNDGTLHNIHPKPKVNKEFNMAMPKFLKVKEVTFDKPEIDPETGITRMIPVRCDVHPWMSGHIGVMSHPFYGVSDGSGMFTLKGVAAGTYTVTAWHEIFGSKSAEVTVAHGGSAAADFTYSLADFKKK